MDYNIIKKIIKTCPDCIEKQHYILLHRVLKILKNGFKYLEPELILINNIVKYLEIFDKIVNKKYNNIDKLAIRDYGLELYNDRKNRLLYQNKRIRGEYEWSHLLNYNWLLN
jgi:hypothetical protein